MALLVLAALARRRGWRVRIIDRNFDEPRGQGDDEAPDLAALTVWTPLEVQLYHRDVPGGLGWPSWATRERVRVIAWPKGINDPAYPP